MIRPVRCKKIACYPVGCDPVRCVSREPDYRWDFRGCLIDRMAGEEATFGRVGSAWCERFGGIVQSPEDVPSYDGQGIRLRREATGKNPNSEDLTGFTNRKDITVTTTRLTRDVSGPSYAGRSYTKSSASSMQIFMCAEIGRVDCDYLSVRMQGTYPDRVDFAVNLTTGEVVYGPAYNIFSDCRIKTTRLTNGNLWLEATVLSSSVSTSSTFLSPATVAQALDGSGSDSDVSVDVFKFQHGEGLCADYIPTNGSPVTRSTEAADGAGNGLNIPLPDDMKAAMGALVQDANGNVLTPTGPELIDNADNSNGTNWSGSNPWVKAAGASGLLTNTTATYTEGKKYLVAIRQVFTAGVGSYTVKLAGGTAVNVPKESGTYIVECIAGATGNLQLYGGSDIAVSVYELSVKEVQPEGSIVLGFIAKYDYDAYPGVASLLLSAKASTAAANGLMYLSGDSPGRVGGYNGAVYSNSTLVEWSAGDLLIAALVWSPTEFKVYLNGGNSSSAAGLVQFQLDAGKIMAKYDNERDDTFVFIDMYPGHALTQAEVEAYNA